MTARTEVRDYVIWSKHLHGDPGLPARIEALSPGDVIDLEVDGMRGSWRKMDQGKDGRPTPGIRPLGSAQEFWRDLYRSRRGDVVSVNLIEATPGAAQRATVILPALGRTDEERRAALDALLALAGQGWRSDGDGFDRSDLHER
jgi:hypothetical protein|tara:strand:+ start:37 stop:468 length:432 start_codon:yes stop_codon:yes gene_type:complete